MHLLHKAHGEFCHLLQLNISPIKPSNIQTMRTPFRLLVAVAALGLAFGLTLTACARTQHNLKNTNTMNDTATLYFAGGCFWGTEHFFKQINGVLDTRVGYANGHVENPTYEQVCGHQTGFAETVEVKYDPQRLPLTLLVQLFFRTIDPTSVNRQGGDVGPQYRTGIYYTDPALRPLLVAEKAKLAAAIGRPVAVEVEPLHNFYAAEDYHQDYLDVHPGGYCHVPSALFEEARRANADAPSKNTYRKPTDEELRRRLTDVQYAVTQKAATEAPHQNAYDKEFRPGIYVDITTGEPLFLSTDKFESGCGWPAFSKPIDPHLLDNLTDNSHGMHRTEVRSKLGGAHLGHVFNDGPKATGGLRYCINSAPLRPQSGHGTRRVRRAPPATRNTEGGTALNPICRSTAFVPHLLRPLLVYPTRGGLRFGGARIGSISLPIRGGALPIHIVTFPIRVEPFPIHVGARSFVSHPCGPQNENSRFLIESGELSVHRPQLLSQG